MTSPDKAVFLVGQRYRHHASHSGYELFHRYIGTHLKVLVSARYLPWKWANLPFAGLTGRRDYAPGGLLAEVCALPHLLRRRRGLYHVLYGDTDFWLLGHLPRPAGVSLAATFHEPLETLEEINVQDRLLRALDAVILVSESQRPFFERRLPRERIFVIPLGVDTQFFRPAERLPAAQVCVTVGQHLRDFETLGKAFELITREYPEARLWAAGTHGPGQRAPLSGPGVELAGRVSDEQLLARYQSARVAVFCYRRATASIGLLEAMACGLPIVATDVGGVPEYLGEAGLLCPPGDPQAVAGAVIRVFTDDRLALDLGMKARKRALAFDFERIAQTHAEVYSQIAALRVAPLRAPTASGATGE